MSIPSAISDDIFILQNKDTIFPKDWPCAVPLDVPVKLFTLVCVQAWFRSKEILESDMEKLLYLQCCWNFVMLLAWWLKNKIWFWRTDLELLHTKVWKFLISSLLVEHFLGHLWLLQGKLALSLLGSLHIYIIPVDYNSCLRDDSRNSGVRKDSSIHLFKLNADDSLWSDFEIIHAPDPFTHGQNWVK